MNLVLWLLELSLGLSRRLGRIVASHRGILWTGNAGRKLVLLMERCVLVYEPRPKRPQHHVREAKKHWDIERRIVPIFFRGAINRSEVGTHRDSFYEFIRTHVILNVRDALSPGAGSGKPENREYGRNTHIKDRYGLIGLVECRSKDVNCNSRAAKHERKYAARHEKFWIRRQIIRQDHGVGIYSRSWRTIFGHVEWEVRHSERISKLDVHMCFELRALNQNLGRRWIACRYRESHYRKYRL